MMNKTSLFTRLILVLFIAILANSLLWSHAKAEKLNIVTTTSDLASIARSVAGEHAVVKSICIGGEDPHFIQAKPSYMVMARDADLWIRVGMDLEIGWEGPVLDGARNMAIREGGPRHLDASEGVLRLGVPSGRITRAMGDVHPQGNPHYWLDPLNARIVAKSIADRLSRIEPKYATDFRKNFVSFRESLYRHMFGKELTAKYGGARLWSLLLKGELDSSLEALSEDGNLGGWLGRMRPFRGEKVVTYHRSWIYFANRFDLVIIEELESKPGIPPSPSHLAEVIKIMKTEHAKAIILEPYYNRKSADLVASKTGAKVAVCPVSVGGAPGITDYLKLIDFIVNQMTKAL